MSKESLVRFLLKAKKNDTDPKIEREILANEDEVKRLRELLKAEPREVAESAIDEAFTEEESVLVVDRICHQSLTAREYLKSLL